MAVVESSELVVPHWQPALPLHTTEVAAARMDTYIGAAARSWRVTASCQKNRRRPGPTPSPNFKNFKNFKNAQWQVPVPSPALAYIVMSA